MRGIIISPPLLSTKDLNMTQYLKSLYLCICLLGGFISCQTNESITQDEEIQTIMEGISNQAGQEKNPYLTAGDKTYIIGTQDGNFPDLGGHTPGEMGGVWNHLIKLLDGFWVKMTDNKGNSCLVGKRNTIYELSFWK